MAKNKKDYVQVPCIERNAIGVVHAYNAYLLATVGTRGLHGKLLNHQLSNGRFYPLGATVEKNGINFAVYSQHAARMSLLLFDKPDGAPTDVIELQARDRDIWHVFVHGLKAGQLYAYKADGKFEPKHGYRFNKNKLLVDPYAKALTGKLVNQDGLLLAYTNGDLSFDTRDNTRIVPKSIAVNDADFDWQGDSAPNIPTYQTIIYEMHVKGFTAHASSKVKSPGTYLGLVEKIPYLKELGITAVELLPVHEHYTEDLTLKKGLTNYWGYNTLCYFAPEVSYGSRAALGCQVNEFKTMVRELHKAGIEVILDVVFNHTCEGNELGPTVCYRGLDNQTYYYLTGPGHEPGRYYADYSGCGNSLNVSNEPVLRLVMDSLRYWVEVMHVDGFRFDLASVLGREKDTFKNTASFFEAISQDPVLNRIKLIAEPWDIRTYQVGNFPVDWCEWNGRFRDVIRKFAKGDAGQMGEAAARIFGSQDIFGQSGRTMFNSVNFVACHDGFTLYDLVSYNHKHNEANQENNRDGSDENNSWNCGFEGATENSAVIRLRKKQIKNFAAYLFLSGGTPMLLGGDEFCRTQAGNNNAYCQDNALSWVDWTLLGKNKDIYHFFRNMIRFMQRFRSSRRSRLQYGNLLPPQVKWYGPDLKTPDWNNPESRTLCIWLPAFENGSSKEDYFVICNADYRDQRVLLPVTGKIWHRLLDTASENPEVSLPALKDQEHCLVSSRSVVMLAGK
jgi:glycogen operon protein